MKRFSFTLFLTIFVGSCASISEPVQIGERKYKITHNGPAQQQGLINAQDY